ncbi:hypothetical protein BU26DRAFT_513392 [Trematosphaeria pertusa]|uniref:Uncharacterized protein n=1 Tax=Trematosphaeria pertusa TaxID=390896 RepID=A0A6A6J2Y9_9PLEO|nr:uncharacterized protein BU26DRAFT_513392 [Trematosphaeria pertusa]KAF2256582.1 hypothetical protein BU26DRAFT_513392 [Trematosphaeria pertusa]
MRLINCVTLQFEEFIGKQIPPYAILSHTWEAHEISFNDYCGVEELRQKLGSEKIFKTCELARNDGYAWVWIDTCCIDKSSSVFKWYRRSARCYVYLSDFRLPGRATDISRCRWFTRGWTLQELIAPRDVRFYDAQWQLFGTKEGLAYTLDDITGISSLVIRGSLPLNSIPVATRMSWAARRETTREEDIAYCLFGIFNVNLPLLYGEGKKAFLRLQEQIIKQTNDLTLFAWRAERNTLLRRGIMAESPQEFAGYRWYFGADTCGPEFSITNKGLKITCDLLRWPKNTWLMPLGHGEMGRVGILLREDELNPGIYYRARAHELLDIDAIGKHLEKSTQLVYIHKYMDIDEE